MKIWNTAPLVRLLLPFIIGIYTAVCVPVIHPVFVFTLALLFASVIIFTFTVKINRSYRISWLYGITITALFFVIGYQLTILKTDQFSDTHFSKLIEKSDCVYARISSSCVEKENSMKAEVEVMMIQSKQKTKSVIGKAVVYFQKDKRSLQLNNGDELILKNKFKEVPATKNPEEFNYKRFLFYKGIYQQSYLKTTEWVYTGRNSCNPVVAYALCLRNRLLSVFQSAHLKGNEFAVAAALLIGYTDKLDADLLSAYSGTGVLHILSVSGMHVAIVFVVFNRMLFFLEKFKYGSLLKTILLIFFLWFYAFLSGLSPSVLRSSTMFSFIVCAKSFKRNSTIYNTLAASALFLLLWNPYLIMDIGFQLSYLAVAGIVYLQPFLSNLVTSENWFLHQLANLLQVSVAAQMATLPVSLYYFHQFPNYFLLSNLLIIPLSTCIIYLGMVLIGVSGNALILKYVAILFGKMVHLLNSLVVYISKLPYALSDSIYIRMPEMWLLYGLIISFHLFLTKKKTVFLKFSLYTIIFLLVFRVDTQRNRAEQKKLIVYAIPGISTIDFISGKEHVLSLDTIGNTENNSMWIKHLKTSWYKLGLSEPEMMSEQTTTHFMHVKSQVVQFYNMKLIILNNPGKVKKWYDEEKKLKVDYVIVSKDANINMAQIKKVYSPTCIVFDINNSIYKLKIWEKECTALHQTFYSVLKSGAFIVEW